MIAAVGAPSTVINVGTGAGVTVRELVASFEKVFGQSVPIVEAPPRPGDAVGAFANVDKSAELLGLEHRAHPRRRDRLSPCVGREAPGDPGLRVTRRLVAALVACLSVLAVALPHRPQAATRRPGSARAARCRWPAGSSCSTRGTSSATTTSRARSTGWCRPAASASPATPPAPSTNRGYAGGDFRLAGRRGSSSSGSRRWVPSVVLTRHANSQRRWGPCVDARGRAGNTVGADLKLSIHADGSFRPRRPRLPRHRAARPSRLDRRHLRAPRGCWPSTCARPCARRLRCGPTTSPAVTASTSAATWPPSTSPTCRP